ncbi:hypothetical protein D3C81_1383870 [compost metagenome]
MQRLQQQIRKYPVTAAFQGVLFFFAGGENGHAFADHTAAAAQVAQGACCTGLAAIENDDFILDVRGFVRPFQNVADANTVSARLIVLGNE